MRKKRGSIVFHRLRRERRNILLDLNQLVPATEFTVELSPAISMRLGVEKLSNHFGIDGGQDAFPERDDQMN